MPNLCKWDQPAVIRVYGYQFSIPINAWNVCECPKCKEAIQKVKSEKASKELDKKCH